MLSYYLLPTTRRLPITQYIIQMSSSLPENPVLGTTKSNSTRFYTIFPMIFHWIPQLLRLISGAWASTYLRITRNFRSITFATPSAALEEKLINVDDVRVPVAPDVVSRTQQDDLVDSRIVTRSPDVEPSVATSPGRPLFSLTSTDRPNTAPTYILYRPHNHIRSQKLLMSFRRQRIKSKLGNRPRYTADTPDTESLQHDVDSLHVSPSPSVLFETAEFTTNSELPTRPVDEEPVLVSSPASTTSTLVESLELPKDPKEILPSDAPSRSPVLPSAQPELPSEEPPIVISTPAPINGSVLSEAHPIPRPSSKSPPPLPRVNRGVFTHKGSFRVRITDKSYCKWHTLVFQHRKHPDEKTASYFKHLHESEEELLEIQRIASLGRMSKGWDPKYQQVWFDWIAKQEFRTWSMTHFSEDRPEN